MKKSKNQNVMIYDILLVIYIIISIILISLNTIFNHVIFIPDIIHSKVVYSENILSILSLNITVTTTLTSISITLVVFLLDKSNIKLFDYLRFVAQNAHCLLILLITLINMFVSLFIIYVPLTYLLDIWLKIAVAPSIILFSALIQNFEVVEKKEKMEEYLLYLLSKKKAECFTDFVLKITNNSFVDEFYDILYNVIKEASKVKDKKSLLSINKIIVNDENINSKNKTYKCINYILKIQQFILPKPGEDLFDKSQAKSYIDIAFNKYKEITETQSSKYRYKNFIEKMRTNLLNHILNSKQNNDQKNDLIECYSYLMLNSYELIVKTILPRCSLNYSQKAINDFLIFAIAFKNKTICTDEMINTYNYNLTGIVCWIIDLIITENINSNHIDIVKMILLKHISIIDLSSDGMDGFYEIFTETKIHKIRYTRTFFIAISLLFLERSEIYETLKKIKIVQDDQICDQYTDILNTYKDVSSNEKYTLNLSETFETKVKIIQEIIKDEIKKLEM